MQPAGLAPNSLTALPLQPAAALMSPTASPSVAAGGVGLPLLQLPAANPLQERLQSHYAASTSFPRSHSGFEFAGNALRPSGAAFAPHREAVWLLVPPAAPQVVLPLPPPLPASLIAPQRPQPPSQPAQPSQSLLLQQQQPQQGQPLQQHQHQHQQPYWHLGGEMTAMLPPEVPLPQPAVRRLPETVIAGLRQRLEQNKAALALEKDQHRRTERNLQEATAVLRRAEHLPKLQVAVWSYLDENDVICGPYSLLQLTALLKGAPQTRVESSETGESVPFVDAIAATPLRTCVLERNTLRERLAALDGSVWRLLTEGRSICLEIQAAEFAALADQLAVTRWLPSGRHAPLHSDAEGLPPPAIRSQLIAGSLAPDAPLVHEGLARLPSAAPAVQAALKPAAEVVAEWEGALHDAQERRAAAAEACAEGAGRVVQLLQAPARDTKAWTYLSGGRPAPAVSFLELFAAMEAGSMDMYTLVASEQPLVAQGAGAGGLASGNRSATPRWLLAAELVRLYGGSGQTGSASSEGTPPPTPSLAASITAAPPDVIFAPRGVQGQPQNHPLTQQHSLGLQPMPLLPRPPPVPSQPTQGAAAVAAAVNGIVPHPAGPVPNPPHPGMLPACLPQPVSVPVPMSMGTSLPSVMSAGSLPVPLTSSFGTGWMPDGTAVGASTLAATALVVAGPAAAQGQGPGRHPCPHGGVLRTRVNSSSSSGGGLIGPEDGGSPKRHLHSRQGCVNGPGMPPLPPHPAQQQQPAQGQAAMKQQGKQAVRSHQRLTSQRSVSPAPPSNAPLSPALPPPPLPPPNSAAQVLPMQQEQRGSSSPPLPPPPPMPEQQQQQKQQQPHQQQKQLAAKLATRLGPQTQLPPPPQGHCPQLHCSQQPSPTAAAAWSSPTGVGADALPKSVAQPAPSHPPSGQPPAAPGGLPAAQRPPPPPFRPAQPAGALAGAVVCASDALPRHAPLAVCPSAWPSATPAGPSPSGSGAASSVGASIAPCPGPPPPATATAPAQPSGCSAASAPPQPAVDPALLAQCVRMTGLQFLQYMRPHLHKLLAVMVEDAYCDYRLRLLEREEESKGLQEQAPLQGQVAPRAECEQESRQGPQRAVPNQAAGQARKPPTQEQRLQQPTESQPAEQAVAEGQPGEAQRPGAHTQPAEVRQPTEGQTPQEQQQSQQPAGVRSPGADGESNGCDGVKEERMAYPRLAHGKAQEERQAQEPELLPHALSPDSSDKEQTTAAAVAARWSEAVATVELVATNVEAPSIAPSEGLKVKVETRDSTRWRGPDERPLHAGAVVEQGATEAIATVSVGTRQGARVVKHDPGEHVQGQEQREQRLGLSADEGRQQRRRQRGDSPTRGSGRDLAEKSLEPKAEVEVEAAAKADQPRMVLPLKAGETGAHAAPLAVAPPLPPELPSEVLPAIPASVSAPSPQPRRSSRINKDAGARASSVATATAAGGGTREEDAAQLEAFAAPHASDAGVAVGEHSGGDAEQTGAAIGGAEERSAKLLLVRDLLDEIVMLALFTVEAQSFSAPAARATRSRRQASSVTAAPVSVRKTRRGAATAGDEDAAGHPAKRQRQGANGKASAPVPAGGGKVRAAAAAAASGAWAEAIDACEPGGDARRRKAKGRERRSAQPSPAASESDGETAMVAWEGEGKGKPEGKASGSPAGRDREVGQEQPRQRPRSMSQSPEPRSGREQQQRRRAPKRPRRESQASGDLEVDDNAAAEGDTEETGIAAADDNGSLARQRTQLRRRGRAGVDAESAGGSAADGKDAAAIAATGSAGDGACAGAGAATPAPVAEPSLDADRSSAGDGPNRVSRGPVPRPQSAASSPRPPRPPRHRGISAKELRALALDPASIAAAAAAAAAAEPDEAAGLLMLRGAVSDPASSHGRRTRATVAANVVAAMAAEALTSMGGAAATAGSGLTAALAMQPDHLQYAQQQLSPTRGSSEATGTAATAAGGDDDADLYDGVSPFMGAASGFRRGAASGMRSHRSLDNLAAEAELALWQAAAGAGGVIGGGRAGRSGSDSGRRPPSRTSSCTQEHLEGIWHSAVCPGEPYGKAMRHDSLTMLLEVSLMTFAEQASAGANATAAAATAPAIPADVAASATGGISGCPKGVAADSIVNITAASDDCDDGSYVEFGGGTPSLPKHARGPRSVRTATRRGGAAAVLAAVLSALDLHDPTVPHSHLQQQAHLAAQQVLQRPQPDDRPAVMPEGRQRQRPPTASAAADVAAAAGELMGGPGVGVRVGPFGGWASPGPGLAPELAVPPDEELPVRPWGEVRLTRQRRNGATTPPLPRPVNGGGSGAARQGAGAVGGGWSTRRNGGSSRLSPLPGDDSAPAAHSGGGGGRHRASTPASGAETTGAGSEVQQAQQPHHLQQQARQQLRQEQQRQQLLRQAALCLLEGPVGCTRGLPLPTLLALARSRSGLATPQVGAAGSHSTAGRRSAATATTAAVGSNGNGTVASAGAGAPPPHPHPRARAAASDHRFLTMAAAACGGSGASAEQVMEAAKWRLQAARAKKLKFGRSRIAGWGLFAVEPIEPSEFVVEYVGEVIRKPLDDVRQREYDAAGYADYMFTVDDNRVVDATLAGNAARFINHCCDPNCVARIVEVGGERRIAIYTLRRIEAGEELHYDYKLSAVPGADRVPCGCGARNCKGFMN